MAFTRWEWGGLLGMVLVLAACTTTPVKVPVQSSAVETPVAIKLPEWVTKPSQTEDEDYVFVASGTSSTGVLGEAEKNASQDLKDQITSFIGVKVTVTTNAVARGSLDAYQANVEQSVLSESKAQVAGLKVAERFPVQTGNSLTLYVKALYKRADLDREKSRIAALFAEIDDAVAKPEKKGDDLAASGHFLEAVDQYLAAVTAAASPGIENAPIKIDRNYSKVLAILGKITLKAVTQEQKTKMGVPFDSPFDVQAVYNGPEGEVPLAGLDLRFNYKTRKNDRVFMTGTNLKTDAQGMASFEFPLPNFAARDRVIVLFDVNPYLERLAGLPRAVQPKGVLLEDLSARSRVSIGYQVLSQAKEIPLVLVTLDLDENAAPLKIPVTGSALQEVLTAAGFTLPTITGFDPVQLRNLDDAGVQKALKESLDTDKPRVAYGTFAISELTQDGKMFTARAAGTLKVFDRTENKLIYVQTRSKRAAAGDKAAAIKAALVQVGQDLGQNLVDELP